MSNLEVLCIISPVSVCKSDLDLRSLVNLKWLELDSFGYPRFLQTINSDLIVFKAFNCLTSTSICELFSVLERKQTKREVISLKWNKIQDFDVKWLKNFVNLKRLFLKYCGLKKFENANNPADAVNFQLDNLIELDLSANYEIQLSFASFANFSHLQELNLCSCKIKSLPHGLFANLTRLKSLNLGANRITRMTRHSRSNII